MTRGSWPGCVLRPPEKLLKRQSLVPPPEILIEVTGDEALELAFLKAPQVFCALRPKNF